MAKKLLLGGEMLDLEKSIKVGSGGTSILD
jgi:hypothetical protein